MTSTMFNACVMIVNCLLGGLSAGLLLFGRKCGVPLTYGMLFGFSMSVAIGIIVINTLMLFVHSCCDYDE